MAREMVGHPSLSLYSNIRSKTWQSRIGGWGSFLRLTDSLCSSAVSQPMAVFKPRLFSQYFSERRFEFSHNNSEHWTILICDSGLICKMVTKVETEDKMVTIASDVECCDGGCDSNETGRDEADLNSEWSFQIKTIIIIEAWPWCGASSLSLSSLSRSRNIIGMIFENICNEAGRDMLLIIITTSALTNVSFTLCCLLKNTDTWGVGGWGQRFFRMSLSVIELFESLLRMMHAQSGAENKALKSSKVHFND